MFDKQGVTGEAFNTPYRGKSEKGGTQTFSHGAMEIGPSPDHQCVEGPLARVPGLARQG